MAVDMFLKLGDIKGESTDKKHEGWIEVLSYSWGVSQPASATATGAASTGAVTAEKASFQDFTIVKRLDKASPLLMLTCARGERLPEVTIQLAEAQRGGLAFMKYTMSDCLISSVKPGGSAQGGESLPLEEVSFSFVKVELNYTATDAVTGLPAAEVKASWDIAANKGV
ncbi:MAG: type VI secretion system tube protein Hcp [Chloroflexi bacterium]|nr:type VI secretion system tube protein Hcp [Chloroflexota bacterium]